MALIGCGRLLTAPCQLLSLQAVRRPVLHGFSAAVVSFTSTDHISTCRLGSTIILAAHACHVSALPTLAAFGSSRHGRSCRQMGFHSHRCQAWGPSVSSVSGSRYTSTAAARQHSHVAHARRKNAAVAEQVDEGEDVDLTEEEDFEFDEDEDFEEGDFENEELDDDFGEDSSSLEGAVADASGAIVNTGQVDWGEVALTITKRILEQRPHLRLFSLRAVATRRRLDIALDKPEDRFGSPSSDDLDSFVREFNGAYEDALGQELAGDIAVEVSSPGAERAVRVPQDLLRFRELPMLVAYNSAPNDGSKAKEQEKVFMLQEVDEAAAVTRWNLADVRVNREAAGKGRRLGKRKLQEVHEISFEDLMRVNLHLDI